MAAGAAVAGRPPYQRGRLGETSLPVGRDKRDHPCAGNLFASAIRGTPLFALAEIVYQKSDPRAGRLDKIRTDQSFTKPHSPAGLPGLSQPGVCLVAL